MNILFIHEVDWLAKVIFDIHFLSESLSLLGHKVFAIDYENEWNRNGLFDMGKLKTREFDGISRAFSRASICLRRPGSIKIAGLSRMSAAVTHYLEIQKIIKKKNIDAIILYSVPTNGLQSIHLARKFNIPIVFRSIDILHILVPYPVLQSVTKKMEKWVYERVDKVLPNTPQYLKYVIDLGVSETKAKWLPFPVDTKLFRPLDDTSELRRKWGFAEKDHIIVFIGTLFEFSGLDEFIPQCHAIIEEVPEARLLIVGDGPQRPTLERIITDLSLQDRVIITGFQPYETMPQYINMATVCINSFCISEKTSDIFPAKIMQYVACGKATAATALRGIMSLLPGESHGVVYANSTDELAREVISLIKSPKRRYQLGQAGLAHVKHNYNHEKIAHQLEKILMKLIKEKKNDPAS